MRVLVAGANGNTGTRVVRQLKERGHEPIAVIRDAAQASKFEAMGVETMEGDLEEGVDVARARCAAAVFAAGSGSRTGKDKTVLVDEIGAVHFIDAALEAGTRRLIMLSSINADPWSEGHKISHYYRAKGVADLYLQQTPLEYTIVRPGRLTDEAGAGAVDLAERLGRSGEIAREDVAHVMVESLEVPNAICKAFDTLAGDTPIRQALERA